MLFRLTEVGFAARPRQRGQVAGLLGQRAASRAPAGRGVGRRPFAQAGAAVGGQLGERSDRAPRDAAMKGAVERLRPVPAPEADTTLDRALDRLGGRLVPLSAAAERQRRYRERLRVRPRPTHRRGRSAADRSFACAGRHQRGRKPLPGLGRGGAFRDARQLERRSTFASRRDGPSRASRAMLAE